MPHGNRRFQIDFDFIDHRLLIQTADGQREGFPLASCSVAEFYLELMTRLRSLGLETRIWTMPVEIADPIPFEADHTHAAYDPEHANRCWRMSTICRSPSPTPASLRRTRSSAPGSNQSLNGAPFRHTPGLRASTGT